MEFLYLLSHIFNHRHRVSKFINKIERILSEMKEDIQKIFYNYEIFQIFESSKGKILIEEGIIGIDIYEGWSEVEGINIFSDLTTIKSKVLIQTTIVDSTFKEFKSLRKITILSSITSIGKSAFSGCSSLNQVTFGLPSSVTSIGDYAFRGCSSLTQISIPSSVTSIRDSAFYGCSSLTQISIPFSVTSIGWNAFRGCSSLTQMTIPSSIDLSNIEIDSKVKVKKI